jgi:hypothetical protein
MEDTLFFDIIFNLLKADFSMLVNGVIYRINDVVYLWIISQ